MTLTDSTQQHQAPTYGNWRRPRSPGLGRLGLGGTIALFSGLILVIIGMAINFVIGLVFGLVVAVFMAPLWVRDRWGRNGYEAMAEQVGWVRQRRSKRHLYVAGPLSRTPVTKCALPGLAARLEASEAHDAHGRPFVVLHHPRPGHVSTVMECSPSGDALVDPDDIDQWVAGWGAWLAGLAHEAGVVGAQVSVETAPDTGVRLRQSVESRLSPNAPELASATMREVIATYPGGSPSTTCRVAITWTRARANARRRTVDDMAVEIGSRLPELCTGLAIAGAGAARPMSLGELSAAIRVAYDPEVATVVDEAGGAGLVDWDDAGPVSAEERRGAYLHDGATSVSWVMGEAPRGAVRSSILRRLLAPHREIARKRVTLLYRPHSPGDAAQIVDNDVVDAMFQATQRKVTRARDSLVVRAAAKAAEEEALGAGLVRFGMIVTATMPGLDADAVNRCVSVVEHLGLASRVRLRRAWRSQATTFTAGLPLGLVLPAHLALPGDWRERV